MTCEEKIVALAELGGIHIHGFIGGGWYVTLECSEGNEKFKIQIPRKGSLASAIDEAVEELTTLINED